jgi:hypothetical protein
VRVRFAVEGAFLLIVAGGAALAGLSLARIILLTFAAWVLVALIERAISRSESRPASTVAPAASVEPAQAERAAPTETPKLEPEPAVVEAEATAVEKRAPAVTKRALDLRGLEEPEAAPEPHEPEPEAQPQPGAVPVVGQPPPPPSASAVEQPPPAREWNIWELERQAREHAGEQARDEEWTALFVHLRQFATTEGLLPKEFDDLVRESFAELIPAA